MTRDRRRRARAARQPRLDRRVRRTARPDAKAVRSWHDLPEWRAFQANAVRAALTSMPSRTHVVFTAHSLPERVLEGDVYVDELHASAEGIAALPGLDDDGWSIGLAVGGADARAVAGPRHRRGARGAGLDGGRRRRAGVSARVHGGPSRGALRPRRRRPPAGGRRWGCASAEPRCSTTTPRCSPRWRPKCERWRHETGRRRRAEASPASLPPTSCGAGCRTRRSSSTRRPTGWAARSRRRRSPAGRSTRALTRSSPVCRGVSTCAASSGSTPTLVSPAASVGLRVVGRRAPPAAGRARARRANRPRRRSAASGIVTEPVEVHPAARPLAADEDISVGALVRPQLGDAVFERLVDPLLGGINAGDGDRLSVRAAAPQLAAAAERDRDLVAGLRAAPPAGAGSGVLRAGRRDGRHWSTRSSTGCDRTMSSCASGPRFTSRTQTPTVSSWHCRPTTASECAPSRRARGSRPTSTRIAYASVALVTMAFDRSSVHRPLDGSGYLVPRTTGLLMSACSWASSKWAHLDDGEACDRARVDRAAR